MNAIPGFVVSWRGVSQRSGISWLGTETALRSVAAVKNSLGVAGVSVAPGSGVISTLRALPDRDYRCFLSLLKLIRLNYQAAQQSITGSPQLPALYLKRIPTVAVMRTIAPHLIKFEDKNTLEGLDQRAMETVTACAVLVRYESGQVAVDLDFLPQVLYSQIGKAASGSANPGGR